MPSHPPRSADARALVGALLFTFALCAVGGARVALAQGRPLTGVVRDSARGFGIAAAEVRIDGNAFRALTDEHGVFRFADGTASAATLRVRRLGYVPRVVTVGVAESAAPIEIALVASAQPLPSIAVRAARTHYTGRLAGYYERLERRTIGTFITRADLERERPNLLTDMIQRAPGVRLMRGRPGMLRVRMRGRECSPLIWLDGAALTVGDVDLDAFSPASLEGIEMYLGASSAPQRYQGTNGRNECGTILLWSRGPDTEPPPAARAVDPAELEAMIASLGVYAAEQVDRPVVLDSASLPAIEYPPALRATGTSGVVMAEFVVDTAGRAEPEYFGVVSATDPLFTAAVREALGRLRFRPALLRGRPVRQVVRLPFEFTAPARDGAKS
jgi:Periplasmic protein TonB, links inner and outer membranes